jgi:phosphatidylglycerophosphate synthase
LTLLAPVLGGLVCVQFLRARAVLPFGLAITAVACLDWLDGAVARAGGRATKFGAYLDAVCDRYVEAMVAVTVAIVTGYWVLITIVLAGFLLVSYAKARAAMEVPIANTEWPDLMERAERDVIFIAGLAVGSVCSWRPLGRDLFWWTLIMLATLTHVTVLQRVLRARRLIIARSSQ